MDTEHSIGSHHGFRIWITPGHYTIHCKCQACERQLIVHYQIAIRMRIPIQYCSDACAAVARRRRRRKLARTCGCGVAFTPKRSDAVYCSNACRQRAHRQSQRP
jgi:hypothetical protein